ncbi:hypothetical protein SLEP1_g24367 [Rubroshorea leprosula]|uniref:Uncharacterized protein n=1 Tax=Rubroshorea leprosula TaxID=152421 RepID=A0AAV5JKR7_9ROSI|nr:hypothetical protein SLEP1_g24367 [Rubroshorea leprosula]
MNEDEMKAKIGLKEKLLSSVAVLSLNFLSISADFLQFGA